MMKRNLILYISLVLTIVLLSCKDDEVVEKENTATLDQTEVTLFVNGHVTLTPTFGDGTEPPKRTYTWTTDAADVIDIETNGTYTAQVTGKRAGTATALLASTDGAVQVTCVITVAIPETSATLQQALDVNVKQQILLTPEFNTTPLRTYTWQANPEGIVKLARDGSTPAVAVEGLRAGTTTLTLVSTDNEVTASTQVTVTFVADDVVKILTIGNSFSEDAVEYYLHGLAQAANKKIVIGNLYIGGAPLALHQTNASSNAGRYSYRKIALNGTKTSTGNVSILTALEDEDWDFISFQQASDFSGQYETFTTPLPYLVNYVTEKTINPEAEYVLHQTWAYAQNSTHPAFPNYGSNQLAMYAAIVDAYQRAANLVEINLVVPSGTAIQNGRTSFVGDAFTSDGYHLNALGRYTASCTWFEKLFGESVLNNTHVPTGYTARQIEVAQHAARQAVLKPYEVTVLTDYQSSSSQR